MFLLSLLLAVGCDRGDHPRQIGRPAPDFTISEGGRSLQLSNYRGKVVVLNFWASWCAPCIEEIPSLNQLQHQMPQLVVLGVDVDEDASAYRQFLADHRRRFLTIRDARSGTATRFTGPLFSQRPSLSIAAARFGGSSSVRRTGPRRKFSTTFPVSRASFTITLAS